MKKRVLILGAEGYLGWPTAMYLAKRGHVIGILDNSLKKSMESDIGVKPLVRIPSLFDRQDILLTIGHQANGSQWEQPWLYDGIDINNESIMRRVLDDFSPDTIIHYAEQPSAPFSMSDLERCVKTQSNNVLGTLKLLWLIKECCPDVHLVKLGTMGEYGTPNIDIEEGYIDITHKGRTDTFLFPKNPGSFYHLSKVHDSNNIYFACKTWGLRATDLNQGVVYGIETDEMYDGSAMIKDSHTSFHYDAVFGTALNRFCTQAVVGEPLTVYGTGEQQRGFLNIKDTMRCVELAVLNPPPASQMDIYNQFTESFSILELAETVSKAAATLGFNCKIDKIKNPRTEATKHYYNPVAEKLKGLGLKPTLLGKELVTSMLKTISNNSNKVDRRVLMPDVSWKGD